MNAENMEKLMKSIEKPGKFQMLVYLYLCVNMTIILMNHLAMVFYAPKTKHHCKVDNDKSIGHLVPIVIRNNERQWEGCRLYAGNNTNDTVPCGHGWTYYLEDGEATIISEVFS